MRPDIPIIAACVAIGIALVAGAALDRPADVPRPYHRCQTCVTQSHDMAQLLQTLNMEGVIPGHVRIEGPGAEVFRHRLRQIAERE